MLAAGRPHAAARLAALLPLLLLLARAAIQPKPGSGSTWAGKPGSKPGPLPGFSGGSAFSNNAPTLCSEPNLPGCQSCPEVVACAACYYEFPNATGSHFVLNRVTGQCDCPPGYGVVRHSVTPGWGRRLLAANTTAALAFPAGAAAAPMAAAATAAVVRMRNDTSLMLDSWGFWESLPGWAYACMPCPVNYYSSGGQLGFALCRPCPGSWTTGGMTASANCLAPYCRPGEQPDRTTGTCRPCPFGWYKVGFNNDRCRLCPANWTTPATGSSSRDDCRVQICPAGQQLDPDTFYCFNCTGNQYSAGGRRENGPYQPACAECPYGLAAPSNRSTCIAGACPQSGVPTILCKNVTNSTGLPQCGPGNKPILMARYCQAYPPGMNLVILNVTNGTLTLYPPVVNCPAGAFNNNTITLGTSVFAGRQCIGGTFTVHVSDPQKDALDTLVVTMLGGNRTEGIPQLALDGYCYEGYSATRSVSTTVRNFTDGRYVFLTTSTPWQNVLQVNCTGNYITRVSMALTAFDRSYLKQNGGLPPARLLPGLSHLTQLSCFNCTLAGTLPPDWGTSSNLLALKYLTLQDELFTGTLPWQWGGMLNLVNLTLTLAGSATFNGTIPDSWGYMRSLAFVNLSVPQSTCAPTAWRTHNGLVRRETLLGPGCFCDEATAGACQIM